MKHEILAVLVLHDGTKPSEMQWVAYTSTLNIPKSM